MHAIGSYFTRKVIIVGVSLITALIITMLVPTGAYWYYAAGAILVLLWWNDAATQRLKKDHFVAAGDWRWGVVPENIGISDQAFDRLRYLLSDASSRRDNREDVVKWVDRKHWLALVGWIGIPVLLLAGSMWLQIDSTVTSHSPVTQTSTTTSTTPPTTYLPEVIDLVPKSLDFAWWQFELADMLLLVAIGFCSIPWLYTYCIITNRRLMLVTVPPMWLPWFWAPTYSVLLSKIEVAYKKDSAFQNMVGCGGAQVDGAAQLDKKFNRIKFVRQHEKFTNTLNAALPDPR